jgi:hypothetical protein
MDKLKEVLLVVGFAMARLLKFALSDHQFSNVTRAGHGHRRRKSAKGDAIVDYCHYRRMFACVMPMSAYQVPDTFTVLFYPASSPHSVG